MLLKGKTCLINFAKGESDGLAKILLLAKECNSPIVTLVMDNSGISGTAGERMDICEKIVNACDNYNAISSKIIKGLGNRPKVG